MLNSTNKYPALRMVSTWLNLIGWLTGFLTAIAALIVLTNGEGGISFVAAIAILIVGSFITIVQFAISESVIVLVDIEQNTRNAASNIVSKINATEPSSEFQKIDNSVQSTSISDNNLTEQQLMDSFCITFDGENYHFMEYKYQNLKDAVNYAKSKSRKT